MKKIFLLTGASGFVGKQILRLLDNENVKIRLILRKKNKNNFKNIKNIEKVFITKDLFSESLDWYSKVSKSVHTIIHAAWYAEPGKYLSDNKNIECLKGTLNFAKGSIKSKIKRFVGIGSCFEYDLNEKKKVTIKRQLLPSSLYSASKISTYLTLSNLFSSAKIEFAWCRLFYLFGEGEDRRRLVPYLHKMLSQNKFVKLGKPNSVRDFLDVKIAAKMIKKVAFGNQQGPINICSGIPVTVKDFTEKIANKYEKKHLLKFGVRKSGFFDPQYVLGKTNIGKK